MKDLPLAPVGGIIGVGRAALFSVLRHLGIVCEDRGSYNFYEAMGLYLERVLRTRDSVFQQMQEGQDIIGTLQQRWFLPRLRALRVACLRELSDPGVFRARSC